MWTKYYRIGLKLKLRYKVCLTVDKMRSTNCRVRTGYKTEKTEQNNDVAHVSMNLKKE